MYCPNCGQQVDNNAMTCPSCGEVLQQKRTKYCSNCGLQIDESIAVCPNCGAAQHDNNANQQRYQQSYQQYSYQPAPPVVDNGGFGWGILGFCIPIVGLVLFLVWKDSKPRTAKASGMGALISVIIGGLLYFFALILGIGAGFAEM